MKKLNAVGRGKARSFISVERTLRSRFELQNAKTIKKDKAI